MENSQVFSAKHRQLKEPRYSEGITMSVRTETRVKSDGETKWNEVKHFSCEIKLTG